MYMLEKAEKNKKTTEDLWNKSWKEYRIPRRVNKRIGATERKHDNLFKTVLKKKESNQKALEIGCGPATWLIWLNKEFGYEIHGVDCSKIACKIAEENLKLQKVKGTILHEDIFEASLEEESFDLVYSMGAIEHFEDPTEIIDKHVKLLKKGGRLFIEIPNFRRHSLDFLFVKLFKHEKELLSTHNISLMELTNLKSYFEIEGRNLKIKLLDYFGPINIRMVPWGRLEKTKVRYLLFILNLIIGYLTFYLKSKYTSPSIILIAEKC